MENHNKTHKKPWESPILFEHHVAGSLVGVQQCLVSVALWQQLDGLFIGLNGLAVFLPAKAFRALLLEASDSQSIRLHAVKTTVR